MFQSAKMRNDPIDADFCLRKAEEYYRKARTAVDPRVKSALEAVAREFKRKARDLDQAAPRRAGLR
jgi:hypothetical protein